MFYKLIIIKLNCFIFYYNKYFGGSLAYVFFTPCFPSFVHKNQFFLRVFYGFRKKRKSTFYGLVGFESIWTKKTKKHRFSASVHFPERTIHMNNGWQKILQDSLLQPQIRSNSIFCRAEMIAQGPQTFLLFSSLFFVILERLGGNVFLIFKNSKIILINFFQQFMTFFFSSHLQIVKLQSKNGNKKFVYGCWVNLKK